jgi:colicin import membrane protein
MRWVIGIVVVAVLALLGYQYFGDRVTEVAEQPGGTEQGADVAGQAAEEAEQAADQAATATEEAATATEQAAEEAATATEQAGEQAAETAERAAGAAGEAAEEAATATEQAGDQAAATAEQAGEAAQGAAEQAQETAEQAAGAQQATEQAAEATEEAAQQAEQAAEGAADTAAGAAPGAEETLTEAQTAALTVGDVNVGEELTDVMQNTEEALQGITDAASAQAAVPKLNDINTRLEELSGTVGQLPDDAKKVLADVLGKRVTELKSLADKLAGQEGVGNVVKPALDPIIAKLEDWAQAPA